MARSGVATSWSDAWLGIDPILFQRMVPA